MTGTRRRTRLKLKKQNFVATVDIITREAMESVQQPTNFVAIAMKRGTLLDGARNKYGKQLRKLGHQQGGEGTIEPANPNNHGQISLDGINKDGARPYKNRGKTEDKFEIMNRTEILANTAEEVKSGTTETITTIEVTESTEMNATIKTNTISRYGQ